jgi:hypothetical protein
MAPRKAVGPRNPYQTSTPDATLSPANQIAFEIAAERRDLLPSVEVIMNAGLDDATTAAALDLFRGALSAPGDPHRDPRTAIAKASGKRA